MKNVILSLTILCSVSLFAQKAKKSSIPASVKEAFAKEFPSVKAKWGMENGGYEAEFKLNGVDASAVYDQVGHRTELEVDINIKDLQASILEYVKKNYPTSTVKEAAKITDDKKVITYEAEIKKDGKSYDILFDANGKFIKIVAGD